MKSLIVLLAGVLMSCSSMAHDATSPQDQISVVGVGQVEAEPDQATLRVSVFAQEPTLPDAKQAADQKYRKVLAVLSKYDIKDKHVKATRILAQPQYEWRSSKRIYKGERVSRSLAITVNELDKVSPLMQALVENEVSTIDGLDMGFKDKAALLEQALGAAADDAKQKATFLATRLGRDLGAAFLITEHNQHAPRTMQKTSTPRMAMAMESADAAPPEMFGTQMIRATVNVSFNLL